MSSTNAKSPTARARLREAAHAIENSQNREQTRAELTDTLLWVIWALHRQAIEDQRGSKAATATGFSRP